MKKLISFIIMLLCGVALYAQMPTDSDYSNWDWEDQSQANWRAKYGNNWVDISPPFASSSRRVGHIVDVHRANDYIKAKGWELVWADFTNGYPFFILYNKHKAIVRAFFYLEDIPFSHVLATLSFHGSDNPAVLFLGNEYQSSTDAYLNNSSLGSDDMISVIISGLAPRCWGVADFPVLFDNNIRNNRYQNKTWVFQSYGCDNYAITLAGAAGTNPDILSGQYTIVSPKSAISGNTFTADYAKVHKQIKDTERLLQEMKTSAEKIQPNSAQFLVDYKKTVSKLNNVVDLVSAVASVSSGFSAVIGFFNLITGTFDNNASTTPAATVQYLQLQGSMKIERTLGGGNTISIPGVSGDFYPSNSDWAFHCPMGIINLKNTPNIKRTSAYPKYGYNIPVFVDDKYNHVYYYPGVPYPGCLYNNNPPQLYTTASVKYPGKFIKYKFDDNVTLTTQIIEGLHLEDVQLAIVCKPNGTGDRKYKVYDQYIAYHKYYDRDGREYSVPLESPVYKALIESKFIIHKFDEDSDEVYFGTPFMNKNELKGVVFEVPEDTDVKLAVYAKFSSTLYSEPIIFKAMYNLNPVPENANMGKVSFNQEQTNFLFSEYYNPYSKLEFNTTRNDQNTATVIEMLPGFVGNPGFIAEAIPVTKGLVNGNTVIDSISFNCANSTPFMARRVNVEFENEEVVEQSPVFYPNPTRGVLYIEARSEDLLQTISVLNPNGQVLQQHNNLNTVNSEIDLSNLNDGMYIIMLKAGAKNYSNKIILQK